MHLFSSGVKISGPDVRIMLECWLHAFEPFQEVSFFMLMCGGPGAGKSMRAKRLQALLATGWVKGSGSSSAKVRVSLFLVPCAPNKLNSHAWSLVYHRRA